MLIRDGHPKKEEHCVIKIHDASKVFGGCRRWKNTRRSLVMIQVEVGIYLWTWA